MNDRFAGHKSAALYPLHKTYAIEGEEVLPPGIPFVKSTIHQFNNS